MDNNEQVFTDKRHKKITGKLFHKILDKTGNNISKGSKIRIKVVDICINIPKLGLAKTKYFSN